ncbi:MAG: diguanylate cyclase [Pseudanabaenaceae cyanobacterium bins.68]|nr:diguanylate cyclase [Pseudanabaenaceae cyanobacterium bins.68]
MVGRLYQILVSYAVSCRLGDPCGALSGSDLNILLTWEKSDLGRLKALGIDPQALEWAIATRLQLLALWVKGASTSEWQALPEILLNFWKLTLPLALHLVSLSRDRSGGEESRLPLVQGIVGLQGSGKSTLAASLKQLITYLGCSCLAFSLDDLYKTFADRQVLQAQFPQLKWRGVPGTHDLDLGVQVFEQLRRGQPAQIPRFDKSTWGGLGDRAGYEVVTAADIVIFEGWCVGMNALPRAILANHSEFTLTCGIALVEYQRLWRYLDRLLVLDAPNYVWSLAWRQGAEVQASQGLSDLEVADLVAYFWQALPPYLYFADLLNLPTQVNLVVEIDRGRNFEAIYMLSAARKDFMRILLLSSDLSEQKYWSESLADFAEFELESDVVQAIAKLSAISSQSAFDYILLSLEFDQVQSICAQITAATEAPVLLIASLPMQAELAPLIKAGALDLLTQQQTRAEVQARLTQASSVRSLQHQVEQSKVDLREMAEALAEALAAIAQQEKLDYLTQVYNRSYFYQQLESEWRRLAREQENLAVILLELDYFRQLNALYGHQSGDDCLKQIAELIKQELKRPADLVARYSDYQFSLILPSTDAGGAIHVTRNIQNQIEQLDLPQGKLSLSVGICSTVPNSDLASESFLRVAEQALLEAKEQGRDRIILKAFEAHV